MPNLAEMRETLYKQYDYKPGWILKVNSMPIYQLRAVYRRFKELADKSAPPRPREATDYLCTDCWSFFACDNPELNECRDCGSKNIRRI